jgi:hypothetical protein
MSKVWVSCQNEVNCWSDKDMNTEENGGGYAADRLVIRPEYH